MSQKFAQIVERVKQLSLDEKKQLLNLLDGLPTEGTGHKAKVDVGESEFEKKTSGKKLDLGELVSRMPADHQATEEDFGEPVGNEEW